MDESNTPATHIDVEVRLTKEVSDFIRSIAKQADVTPHQAASVMFALSLARQNDKAATND